ncbi:LysR substrate binding domain protein [compost metagenome]
MGLARQVAATFSHIVALPAVVAGSDLIATLATSVARQFADPSRIQFLPLPSELAMPAFPIECVAGRQVKRDPALAWLCDTLSQLNLPSFHR